MAAGTLKLSLQARHLAYGAVLHDFIKLAALVGFTNHELDFLLVLFGYVTPAYGNEGEV